jgi:hypothetical protein
MSYYVYLLTDPRNNDEEFYCGKGTGDRWKSHLGHWSNNGENNPTSNKIKKIQEQGLQPGVIFLHKDIEDENLAYRLEEDYIRANFQKLTNLKIEAKPPKNTGGRFFKKTKKSIKEQSERLKVEYATGRRKHWTTFYSKEEISRKISMGDPGKSKRGKPSPSRTPVTEITTQQTFVSQTEAANILKLKQGDINSCLRGRQKSTKGYMFKYA